MAKGWIRQTGRRIRRRLGLPPVGWRTTLLALLAFIGLAYVSVTVLADFFTKLGQHAPQYYEPKDFEREEHSRKLQLKALEDLKEQGKIPESEYAILRKQLIESSKP